MFASRTETHCATGCPRQRKRSLSSTRHLSPKLPARCQQKNARHANEMQPDGNGKHRRPPQHWLTQSLALPEHSNPSCTAAVRNVLPGRADAAAREPRKRQQEVVGLRRRRPRPQAFHRAQQTAAGKVQAELHPANAPRRAGKRQLLAHGIHFPARLGLINCIFWP